MVSHDPWVSLITAPAWLSPQSLLVGAGKFVRAEP